MLSVEIHGKLKIFSESPKYYMFIIKSLNSEEIYNVESESHS